MYGINKVGITCDQMGETWDAHKYTDLDTKIKRTFVDSDTRSIFHEQQIYIRWQNI